MSYFSMSSAQYVITGFFGIIVCIPGHKEAYEEPCQGRRKWNDPQYKLEKLRQMQRVKLEFSEENI